MSRKKIEKKRLMEVIYDAFEIPVLISINTDGNISNTTCAESTSSPKTTDTTNPTSTKSGQMGKFQEEKKTRVCRPPKEEVLCKLLMRKLTPGKVL